MRFPVGYSMANEEFEIRISKIFVRSECENCFFRRNDIEIEGTRFNNNAGYTTINHLKKHNDHIIRLIVANLIYRYRLDNNIFHQIENEVKGD